MCLKVKSNFKRKYINNYLFFLLGLVFGIGLTLFFINFQFGLKISEKNIPENNINAVNQKRDTTVIETSFDFYKLLPQNNLSDKFSVSNDEAYVYLIQVGSFEKKQDALKLKAHLLLTGLMPEISKVVTDSNKTWYRVKIGPFSLGNELDETKEILKNEKISNYLLLKKRLNK